MTQHIELRTVLYFFCILALWLFVSYPLAKIAIGQNGRSRVIDFEDQVVEGINKQPLDSLSQISKGGRRGSRHHLYKKRAGFRTETSRTLKELRYL